MKLVELTLLSRFLSLHLSLFKLETQSDIARVENLSTDFVKGLKNYIGNITVAMIFVAVELLATVAMSCCALRSIWKNGAHYTISYAVAPRGSAISNTSLLASHYDD